MFRPVELCIGLRYTRARRRNHFISFISFVSTLGIALGITALITVLSVMNGFQTEVRERMLGMTAHVTIGGFNGTLGDWPAVAERARAHAGVSGAAPFVQAEGMLANGKQISGGFLRGVLPEREHEVSIVPDRIVAGSWNALAPGAFGIVLGDQLAITLGLSVGDKVTMVTPQALVTPAGILPRIKRFTVVALFHVDLYEYDRSMAYVHLQDAQRLFQLGEGVSGVRLRLADLMQSPRVARDLAREFPPDLQLSDWTRQHANYFRAVQIEKRMMFIILTLIVAVAAFNIVSTLVMLVTDKEADIAILRTLGATPASVMTVFMISGTLIGVLGTLLGTAGGVALALNVDTIVPAIEHAFGFRFLPPDVYQISELPSELRGDDVARVSGIAFALAVIATLYPAWRAARTQPAQALRYE